MLCYSENYNLTWIRKFTSCNFTLIIFTSKLNINNIYSHICGTCGGNVFNIKIYSFKQKEII